MPDILLVVVEYPSYDRLDIWTWHGSRHSLNKDEGFRATKKEATFLHFHNVQLIIILGSF